MRGCVIYTAHTTATFSQNKIQRTKSTEKHSCVHGIGANELSLHPGLDNKREVPYRSALRLHRSMCAIKKENF